MTYKPEEICRSCGMRYDAHTTMKHIFIPDNMIVHNIVGGRCYNCKKEIFAGIQVDMDKENLRLCYFCLRSIYLKLDKAIDE